MAAARSALVPPLLLACALAGCSGGSNPGEPRFMVDGTGCTGDAQCISGHCNAGVCCTGNDRTCCRTAADCPAEFRSGSVCDVGGRYTECQGTRRDAVCEGYVCSSVEVPDDSGCAGEKHDCNGYLPIACSTSEDQSTPVCSTSCAAPGDCSPGYSCVSNACVKQVGTGDPCTGTGQGSCAAGLKCENSVCCSAAAGQCCSVAKPCGTCMACGPDSYCLPMAAKAADSRCPTSANGCLTGTCNGHGACAVATTCNDGDGCTGNDTCTASGACYGCTCSGPNGTICAGGTDSTPCGHGITYYDCDYNCNLTTRYYCAP